MGKETEALSREWCVQGHPESQQQSETKPRSPESQESSSATRSCSLVAVIRVIVMGMNNGIEIKYTCMTGIFFLLHFAIFCLMGWCLFSCCSHGCVLEMPVTKAHSYSNSPWQVNHYIPPGLPARSSFSGLWETLFPIFPFPGLEMTGSLRALLTSRNVLWTHKLKFWVCTA